MDLEPGWGGDEEEEGKVGIAGFGWERHELPLLEKERVVAMKGREVDTEVWADGVKDEEEEDDDGEEGRQVVDLLGRLLEKDPQKRIQLHEVKVSINRVPRYTFAHVYADMMFTETFLGPSQPGRLARLASRARPRRYRRRLGHRRGSAARD